MTIDRTDPYTRLNPRPVPTEDYTREETYRHTRAPVDLAVTLIPDAYTSREFFEIERERVFAASWVVVSFTSQVEEPGQVIVAEQNYTQVKNVVVRVGRNSPGPQNRG